MRITIEIALIIIFNLLIASRGLTTTARFVFRSTFVLAESVGRRRFWGTENSTWLRIFLSPNEDGAVCGIRVINPILAPPARRHGKL